MGLHTSDGSEIWQLSSKILRQAFSFLGGILAVLFSLLLSRLIGTQKRLNLLLSGIITGALTNSAVMTFKYLADPVTQLADGFFLLDQSQQAPAYGCHHHAGSIPYGSLPLSSENPASG